MSTKNPVKDVLTALGLLKGVDSTDISNLLTETALEKAESHVGTADKVMEVWEAEHLHSAPPKRDINVGPGQHASGFGAEKMQSEYAHPAPQIPLTMGSEKLQSYLNDMHTSVKALSASQKDVITTLQTIKAAILALSVVKAADTGKVAGKPTAIKAEDEDDEEADEEESEVVEINEAKSKSLLAKADRLIRTIKSKTKALKAADMDDEEEKCNAKALKAEIKALKKAVAKLLGKARLHAFAASSETLKADIRKAAAKADVDVVQEEEDDEEDEEEGESEGKSEKALKAQGQGADKGNQADHAATGADKGNQADAAKSVSEAAVEAKIKAALSGVAPLEARINQVYDMLMGKSKVQDLVGVPDLAKAVSSNAFSIATLMEKIDEAEATGALSSSEAFAATNIASNLESIHLTGGDVKPVIDRLVKSTTNVKQLFASTLGGVAQAA